MAAVQVEVWQTDRCRTWVGDEDQCGETTVLINLDTDRPHCATHAPELEWLHADGWIPKHQSPLEFIDDRFEAGDWPYAFTGEQP